jgi:hypothetical protein
MSTHLQAITPADIQDFQNAKVEAEIQQPKSSILWSHSPNIPDNYWDHSLNMDFLKALKELIDNALNNRMDGATLTFVVQHFLDFDNNLTHIMFHDDGKGVDVGDLDELRGWIDLKSKKTENQLSTHGVGMKHSLAAFDGTQGITWVASNHSTAGYCSFDDICHEMILYSDDRFWKQRPANMQGTGMSACVNYSSSNLHVSKKVGDATTVMGQLGATYKHYLQSNQLKICFEWVSANDTTDTHWIQPKTRPYVTKGKSEPIYNRTEIEATDKSWKILLTFGKNGNAGEITKVYPQMDASEIKHITGSKGRHPYSSTSKKSGMDIVEHDRVIELNTNHILTEYDEESGEAKVDDKMGRNEYIGMGGEIVLVYGFETTETKEIKKNLAYRQMCNKVVEFLKGGNALKLNHFHYDPKQNKISGDRWRDAVARSLTDDEAQFAGKWPETEDPIPGYLMKHDIRIYDSEDLKTPLLAIECKACEIDFSHVSKFRSQLEIENLTEGWIVTSEGISDDANREVQRLKGLTNPINIEIKDWSGKATRVLQILNEN